MKATVSAAHRQRAREQLKRWQRVIRPTLPKCGAKSRVTGEPCQQTAMANGRCYVHGGRTPKGDAWHKPRWPNGDAPDAETKLCKKLRDHDRARKRRANRLAAMTPEERERHERWQRTHKPGKAAVRKEARLRREQAAAARAAIQRAEDGRRSDASDLQRAIEALKKRLPKGVDIFD